MPHPVLAQFARLLSSDFHSLRLRWLATLACVPVRFTILGSGSNGNCAYLETDATRLLIDAGFSARQIRQRLAGIGRSPETLDGILITHEHSDHIRGLDVLCRKLDIPIYCNRLTRDAIAYQMRECRLNFRVFETGSAFELGEVEIEAFSVPHDAQDPVGYLLRTAAANIGFLTDLGHATRLVLERVRPANVLLLEANHDLQLLQDDLKRPWSVKQRILSRHGHLSNGAAADALTELMNADLRHVFLGHLSRDCNRPDLAEGCVARRCAELGAAHVRLEVTSQDAPASTVELGVVPVSG
ncbi:MAG: MBL fold metallo-hydrolase [Verrucomicrobiae bacterium]|nr:MBL fold metallo-hydrolase [Verrucomicrobiae bacterium]MCP5524427.1 MBL fold metallo-hydrolase [Verrucomicrobiales bacterium]